MPSPLPQSKAVVRHLYAPNQRQQTASTPGAPLGRSTAADADDAAARLDAWQTNGTFVPPCMLESSGTHRALRQPVLAVPSGRSLSADDARRLGIEHVPNGLLQQAMQRLVAGEADWNEVLCPISLDLLQQPVQIASPLIDKATGQNRIEQYAYELALIETWLAARRPFAPTRQGTMPTSPMTRAYLRDPVVLVANEAIADLCRSRRGLPPMTQQERQQLHSACRIVNRAINQTTHEARRAFYLAASVMLAGVCLAISIETVATEQLPDLPLPPKKAPRAPDDAAQFWRACLGIEVAGEPTRWAWTADLARRGCGSQSLACRQAASQAIADVCLPKLPDYLDDTVRPPPYFVEHSAGAGCSALHFWCNIGQRAYVNTPHDLPANYCLNPWGLWPYHLGALAVLAACGWGARRVINSARRTRRLIAAPPD